MVEDTSFRRDEERASIAVCLAQGRPVRGVLYDVGNVCLRMNSPAIAQLFERIIGVRVTPDEVRRAVADALKGFREYLKMHDFLAEKNNADGVPPESIAEYSCLCAHLLACTPDAAVTHPSFRAFSRELYAVEARGDLYTELVDERLPEFLSEERRLGLMLAAFSNTEGKLVKMLNRAGLTTYFDVIFDSTAEGLHKPDPRSFGQVAEYLGLPLSELAFIDDMPKYLRGGMDLGIRSVHYDPMDIHAEARVPGVPVCHDLALFHNALMAAP